MEASPLPASAIAGTVVSFKATHRMVHLFTSGYSGISQPVYDPFIQLGGTVNNQYFTAYIRFWPEDQPLFLPYYDAATRTVTIYQHIRLFDHFLKVVQDSTSVEVTYYESSMAPHQNGVVRGYNY